MRKMICGVIAIFSFFGMGSIPDMFDFGYISFGTAIFLLVFFGTMLVAGLYGAEAFIFQMRSKDNDKKID